MRLLSRQNSSKEAGESALAIYRAKRNQTLRENWKDWIQIGLAVLVLTALSVTEFVFWGGSYQLATGFSLGVAVVIAVVGWEVGGDVHNLPWLWGSIGEQQTEELLEKLDDSWECIHDISRKSGGNWDHVLVGPAGIFLLDSKRYYSMSIATDDELRVGRASHRGSYFRSAAISLKYELEPHVGKRWVNAVIVIWGDFPQKRYAEKDVVYLQSDELLGWLSEQPGRLSERERRAIAQAVRELKISSREPIRLRSEP